MLHSWYLIFCLLQLQVDSKFSCVLGMKNKRIYTYSCNLSMEETCWFHKIFIHQTTRCSLSNRPTFTTSLNSLIKPVKPSPHNDQFNPLNAELNPICYKLALLGAPYVYDISRLRVKTNNPNLSNSSNDDYFQFIANTFLQNYAAPSLQTGNAIITVHHQLY
jgi:hypothetical protein